MGKNTEIFDGDLNPLLEIATREDLQFLVDLLTGDPMNNLATTEAYQRFSPDHPRYADLIAKELREFGGHSVVNYFRNAGPAYKEIVGDVATKLKVPFNPRRDIAEIEDNILEVVLEKTLNTLSDADKAALLQTLGEQNVSNLSGSVLTGAVLTAFRLGGFKSYMLAAWTANYMSQLLGFSLSLGANAGLMKILGVLTGPIGIGLTALWTGYDLGGAAYRITVPAVVYIAMLRKKYTTPAATAPAPAKLCGGCQAPLPAGAKFCPACGRAVAQN